ncbi:MAG: type II toxin-antitoxin system RelE/ParE family toxin [Sphingobacteriales bacterium]
MRIKWNKRAIQQLLDAIRFIEENDFYSYAAELEKEILSRIRNIPQNPTIYPLDKYRRNNDGSYHAFEVDQYRISYRNIKDEIRIVRIRHTSRRTRKY